MSGFSSKQLRALSRKLDRRHVHTREHDGRAVDYIEGWFAIAEANSLFGFDGWDREMTHFERLYERRGQEGSTYGALARVRIRVRAGDAVILREGTGFGHATARASAEAYERAIKAAETDATKRALATFGNRFGLGLYDKDQNGVTPRRKNGALTFDLVGPDGSVVATGLSPESFCGAMRQLIERVAISEIEPLLKYNETTLERLRAEQPALKTSKGVHYADVLKHLGKERLALAEPGSLKPSRIAPGSRIDKSLLPHGEERRFRDKAHLQYVASHPCLICGRAPAHAHHLTFAQKRGLAIKVSDEFTVPLCAVHHDEVHRNAPKEGWWQQKGIDPIAVANDLWAASRRQRSEPIRSAAAIAPVSETGTRANGGAH